MGMGRIRENLGAADIVVGRRFRIHLHQGHMLVGGGMKDNLGLMIIEYGNGMGPVPEVAHKRYQRNIGKALPEFSLYIKQRGFGLVEQDDKGRAESGDLTAYLAANAPGRSGDQNSLAPQIAFYTLNIK